ncbi:MAG: GNAT family N-acetyltransferase, partial [Gammaproteobacteria bacterium]
IAPKLGFALRETRDRLTPGRLLLRELIAAEMQAPLPAIAGNDSSRLEALATTSRRDILAAQRLRYRVFTEEYGAKFDGFAGIDRDRYDRHCRHVVVKDRLTGQVIAYTRILTGERARKTGGWYSAGEFKMDMVDALPGRVLEIGRTCVHPEYRSGAAIGVLWAQLARILLQEGHRYLIGCASIALSEPGAGAMLADLSGRVVDDVRYRVTPLLSLPAQPVRDSEHTKLPPLLRTYLSMGAKVCGAPCWDPDFNCADVFILVDVQAIPARYVRHFMGEGTAGGVDTGRAVA